MGNHKSKTRSRSASEGGKPSKKEKKTRSDRSKTVSSPPPKKTDEPTKPKEPIPLKTEASLVAPVSVAPPQSTPNVSDSTSDLPIAVSIEDAIKAAMDPEPELPNSRNTKHQNSDSTEYSNVSSNEVSHSQMIWSHDSIILYGSNASMPGFDEVWTEDAMVQKSVLPENIDLSRLKNPNEIDPEVAFLPPVVELDALKVLNDMQLNAVRYVVTSSKKKSEQVYPDLVSRVKAAKFTEDDLRKTLRYIRDEAPIIIHLKLDQVLELLAKDTHYRNQFETNRSGGYLSSTSRTDWENRLFNNLYSQSTPYDRCKYGVLNICNDPHGVKACSSYGDSYFTLRKVRLRTSFADKDTSNADVKLASCEYYAHVLAAYSPQELAEVIEVATGKKKHIDSTVIVNYKEIQIHGPVELKTHIESVHVAPRHKNDSRIKKLVEEFSQANNCSVVWI